MSQVVQSKSKLEEARRQERSQKREKSPWATSISIESGSTDTVQLSRKPAHQAGVESLLLKREAELITNSPQRAMQVDAGGSRQIREGKEEADNCRLSEMADAKQKGVKAVQKRRERRRARCEEVRSGETSFDVCPLRKGGGRRVSATEQENMKKINSGVHVGSALLFFVPRGGGGSHGSQLLISWLPFLTLISLNSF